MAVTSDLGNIGFNLGVKLNFRNAVLNFRITLSVS